MTYDVRGLWMMQMIGASSYTHRNPPNAQVGDALFVGMGAVFCVDRPGAPATTRRAWSGTATTPPRGASIPAASTSPFGDGHVSFVSNTIDLTVWHCLGAMNDGTPISGGF